MQKYISSESAKPVHVGLTSQWQRKEGIFNHFYQTGRESEVKEFPPRNRSSPTVGLGSDHPPPLEGVQGPIAPDWRGTPSAGAQGFRSQARLWSRPVLTAQSRPVLQPGALRAPVAPPCHAISPALHGSLSGKWFQIRCKEQRRPSSLLITSLQSCAWFGGLGSLFWPRMLRTEVESNG